MDGFLRDHEPSGVDTSNGEPGEIMQSQDLLWELAGHRDADVTVAVGTMMIDVCAVTYFAQRERFVLHVASDDIADAVRQLACVGLKSQPSRG